MPDLIAKSALSGQDPVVHGDTTLAEVSLGSVTSIACFPGQMAAVTAALGHFPAPNTVQDGLCWTGPDQAFLLAENTKVNWPAKFINCQRKVTTPALNRVQIVESASTQPSWSRITPQSRLQTNR